MAGYSGTPLAKKLGLKQGYRICVKNPPRNYDELLNGAPEGIKIVTRLTSKLDMIHLFTKSKRELYTEIKKYIDTIKPNGIIWISWPKKSSKVDTDVTEDIIREVVLPTGLVDVKVCAVDDTWSGLKLVIRKGNRR